MGCVMLASKNNKNCVKSGGCQCALRSVEYASALPAGDASRVSHLQAQGQRGSVARCALLISVEQTVEQRFVKALRLLDLRRVAEIGKGH